MSGNSFLNYIAPVIARSSPRERIYISTWHVYVHINLSIHRYISRPLNSNRHKKCGVIFFFLSYQFSFGYYSRAYWVHQVTVQTKMLCLRNLCMMINNFGKPFQIVIYKVVVEEFQLHWGRHVISFRNCGVSFLGRGLPKNCCYLDWNWWNMLKLMSS